jgi:hypothetical protein
METKDLTAQELSDHLQDEEIIERGLKSFYEVGSALLRIRDRRSYRKDYATFEDYCRDRWDMTRQHVNRKIAAAKTVDDLEPMGSILPTSERQARPLYDLTLEDKQAVWKRVVNSGQKITAKLISDTADTYLNEVAPDMPHVEPKPEPKRESYAERIKREAEEEYQREEERITEEHRKTQEEIKNARRAWEEMLKDLLKNTGLNLTDKETELSRLIIEAGYRAICKKIHPDVGGSHEDMVALNNAKDKLLSAVR